MAEVNLKRLSRSELLEMMITFSEEAEAAKKHEQEYKEGLEREMIRLQHEMAEERAAMLKNFDEEKNEMRIKFNEQKAQMQEKFDKDIAGLKARLQREKDELQRQVDDSLLKINNSQSLAEASIKLGGIMEAGQRAADLYVETLKKSAEAEYKALMKEIEESRARIKAAEAEQMKKIAVMKPEAPQLTVVKPIKDIKTVESTTVEIKPVKESTAEIKPVKTRTRRTKADVEEVSTEIVVEKKPVRRARKKKDEQEAV